MTYYVVSPDGQKYGPGDVVTLNQWVQQGRVLPTTVLEDVTTGARLPASQVPGMMFAPASTGDFSQPPSYQQYPRTGYGLTDNGDGDYQKALIFGILAILQCLPIVLAAIGIYYASLAQRKGHPKAKSVMTLCIIGLVLGPILGAILGGIMSFNSGIGF
jgi:hypothetical protein